MIDEKKLIAQFLELAAIDSPSGEEDAMAKHVGKVLADIGLAVTRDNYGNVIGHLAGMGKPLLLNAHLDTVEPGRGIKPIVDGNVIRSNGQTIVAADAKAGLAIIIESLRLVKDLKDHRAVDVVFTREEETSLGGASNLDYSKVEAKEGIVFDGDEAVTNIFISSPTYYNLDAEIIGRSAHAGVEPEKGISAIQIASRIISQLPLGRIDEESTMNIGIINGGQVRNAVPEKVVFEGEIRSRNNATIKKLVAQVREAFAGVGKQYPEAKITLKLAKEFDGFLFDENHPMVKLASAVLKDMGLKPLLINSGGASDANIFCTHAIDVVIVGTGVYDPHTTREHLKIDEFIQAAQFCEQLMSKL